MNNNDIVQKLWSLCDVLRDDGINYSDYVTELVLLLFIKMEYENTQSGVIAAHKLPEYARWNVLTALSGLNLLNEYRAMLLKLSVHQDPLISAIYADAQTRLREPRHLEHLIKALDGLDWFSAQKDGLGDLYEGLLEKTPARQNPAPASTLRRARSSTASSRWCSRSTAKPSRTRPPVRQAS
ncbi:type I restriction-modification system subunit M N-terminal domain-containing protein [Vogesella fluminis]|uniref:type I restriction-modification system subunit M N-terminal domain-containing protein n=1 Tax=Vogesella fluminis TaxID=1069161 RepID=UPI0036267A4E